MVYGVTVHRIVRQKKGDNQYIERHSHPYFHYIYILSGKGRIFVDAYELLVSKYDLILVPPAIEHEIYGLDGLTCLDLKFSCDENLTEMLSALGYFINGVNAYEDSLIRDIFDEAVNARELYEHVINSRILELFFHILRRKKKGVEMINQDDNSKNFLHVPNKEKANKIRKVLAYLDEKVQSPIKVAELAAQMGYNESYFSTFFKECTGFSPSKYINILKVEKAKEMMLYTSWTFTHISEALGYESIHYFSKVFKQITGTAPSSYMNKAKINMTFNVIKDSEFLPPEGEYEIQIKDVETR